jgi:hypothetical protein
MSASNTSFFKKKKEKIGASSRGKEKKMAPSLTRRLT